MWKLEKGDIVKCIIPSTNELTIDKEYKVLSVDESISHIEVINDEGKRKSYLNIRFDKETLWVIGH